MAATMMTWSRPCAGTPQSVSLNPSTKQGENPVNPSGVQCENTAHPEETSLLVAWHQRPKCQAREARLMHGGR